MAEHTFAFDFTSPSTVTFTASGASSRIALTQTALANGMGADAVMIYNSGTVPAFIVKGDVTVVATTAGFCIPPGAIISVALGNTSVGIPSNIAAITASGTAVLYLSGCRIV